MPAEGIPALKAHTIAMYDEMLKESHIEEDINELVYDGFITHTYARTGASHVYQMHVMGILREFNCIAVARVGVRNSTTRAVMLNHPSDADIPADAWSVKRRKDSAPKGLTDATGDDKLSQSVRNLAAQIGSVSLPELAKGLYKELDGIKTRLAKLEQER